MEEASHTLTQIENTNPINKLLHKLQLKLQANPNVASFSIKVVPIGVNPSILCICSGLWNVGSISLGLQIGVLGRRSKSESWDGSEGVL